MVERLAVNEDVAGSSPAAGAIQKDPLLVGLFVSFDRWPEPEERAKRAAGSAERGRAQVLAPSTPEWRRAKPAASCRSTLRQIAQLQL